MAYQAVFKRFELKYILNTAQRDRLLQLMEPYMSLDQYGYTTIRNLYFDTPDYRLIRRSIERPVFKEKLRFRSYCQLRPEEPAFVEIKRKYQSQVYKRRLSMPERSALNWLSNQVNAATDQIGREIEYFRDYYQNLEPRVYLCYDRCAYRCRRGGDFRITLDDNICARLDRLSLCAESGGKRLLPEGYYLMEIKTADAIPLWLTRWLSEEKLYKTSFSKYGTAYQTMIFKGENTYV